jgi:hypothetical protein
MTSLDSRDDQVSLPLPCLCLSGLPATACHEARIFGPRICGGHRTCARGLAPRVETSHSTPTLTQPGTSTLKGPRVSQGTSTHRPKTRCDAHRRRKERPPRSFPVTCLSDICARVSRDICARVLSVNQCRVGHLSSSFAKEPDGLRLPACCLEKLALSGAVRLFPGTDARTKDARFVTSRGGQTGKAKAKRLHRHGCEPCQELSNEDNETERPGNGSALTREYGRW